MTRYVCRLLIEAAMRKNIKQAIRGLQKLYVDHSGECAAIGSPAALAVLLVLLARWRAMLAVGAWHLVPEEMWRVALAVAALLLLIGRRKK